MFLCILFGANTVAVKISLTGLGVFTTAGLRFGIAAVVISFWAICTGRPMALTRRQARLLAPLGIIFFCQLALFNSGQSMTMASHGTLISNVLPFVVMILAHFFIPGETIRLQKVVGLVLGFAGVAMLFFDSVVMTGEALQGDLLILLAVMVWACNAVYVKKIIGGFHPLQITLYPMVMAVPVFLVCGYFFDGGMVRSLDAPVIKALLYQALVTASFGFVAWNTLISKYGATALHSFVFIMPVSGVFLGVVMLGEPVTAHLITSIVLVTAGLIVVNGRRVAARPGKETGMVS
ncbi:MAG: DMT family transporter [Proteobacteria bacterium]|nr:DMT family transporter [Pseudomonadota bacterium]